MARRTPAAATACRSNDERGSGLVSTSFGVAAFLVLVLFATQVLLHLHATSVVTAVAHDAAREVAAAQGAPSAVAGAEARARAVLGRYGARVSFEWRVEAGDVVVRARAANRFVTLLGAHLPALERIDRTVRVRVECVRTDDGACE